MEEVVFRAMVIASFLVVMASCNSSNSQHTAQVAQAAGQPASRPIPIWPNGAPDMDGVVQPSESVEITQDPAKFGGLPVSGVRNVSQPTMTVYRPRGTSAHAAVVVFPGGGFEELAIDLEGTEICDWFTARGFTCVLAKYRVPKSDDQFDGNCGCHRIPKVRRALQDAQRTIRLVRSQSESLQIAPDKIGVIGFSAGGYLVAETSNVFEPAYKPVDKVDQISSRPDFAIAVYPGHISRPGWRIDPSLHVTRQTPPTFLIQAWDDDVDGIRQSLVYARALEEAGVPTEVHLFAKGGHAFGMRPTGHPVDQWPKLVEGWLAELGLIR